MKAPYFLCIYNYKGYTKSSPGKAKQPYVQLLHSLAMLGCLSQPWNTAFILSNDKQEENKCCCEAWAGRIHIPIYGMSIASSLDKCVTGLTQNCLK